MSGYGDIYGPAEDQWNYPAEEFVNYDREERPWDCANCGYPRSTEESYPCKGSDVCESRIGECCKQQCGACGLTMCEEHSVEYAGEKWCSRCMAVEAEAGTKVLEEIA